MSWQQALPRFSLDRKITVLVIMMTALVVGAISTINIPLELVPRGFEAPTLTVTASWRDAPPRDVLDKLAIPLEEELSTVRGLEQINSWSATGRVQVFLVFKQGTDMDVAYREARDRILRARARMPDDVEPVRILKLDSSSVPIMVLGVAIDPRVTDAYNLLQTEIVRRLQRVEGVASARSQGILEKEVLIELDREKTRAAGLNIYLVAQKLAGDNFALASGDVRAGDQKLLLRSMARYPDVETVAEQLVAPSVRIADIGTVRYAEPEKLWRVRVNSKPALAIEVYKEGQANTIEVGERLEAEFAKIVKNPKLASSELGILFTQSTVIKESIGTLTDSGKLGAALAAMVLFFFLRRFRMTIIIALAIPLSMVIALTSMYFAGETLNILSLLGLIISVGLLVDNSVVVAENIIRLHRAGVPRRTAAIEGTSEIALAVILATLTSIVVFLPVALVEGRAQFFLLRLAMPLTVSLAASLFVALIFIPLCIYLTLPDGDRPQRPLVANLHQAVDRTFGALYRLTLEPLNRGYNRLLGFFLRRRFDLVFAVVVVFAFTLAGPAASLEVVEVSEEDRQDFEISVDLPDNYSLEDAVAYFDTAELELETIKEELELEGFFTFHTASFGKIQGWFPGRDDLNRTEVTDLVMKRLPKRPGVELFTGNEGRGEQAGGKNEHVVVIHGEDPEVLDEIAADIEETATALPGVIGTKRATEMLTPNEVAVIVDRDRAARFGLNPRLVAGAIAVGLRGQPLPRLHWDGKVVPVRIRFQEEDRRSLGELADFGIPTGIDGQAPVPRSTEGAGDGGEIQLSAISDTEFLTSTAGIFREDKRISRRITFDLDPDDPEAARARIDALVASFNLPEGVRLGARMAGARLDEEVESLRFAALISVLFVYLLMGFLFESYVLPLSIILTIPLATLGVLWSHFFAGRDLDFLGFIGVILLIGVVVNNGIVLIDYAQRLRAEGVARTEAVLMAARRRFRPIMMTALSTIVGMIPLTVGAPTSIGLSYRSFGLALIGGMVTATFLTLLVVPVFYTLFDDARVAVLRATGLRKPPTSKSPPA